MIGYDEDPNFVDFDNDVAYDQDDMLYDKNVTDEIEAGLDGCERGVEDELVEGNDFEGNDLIYPSSSEYCPNALPMKRVFINFLSEMKNPDFEVRQLFCSTIELEML